MNDMASFYGPRACLLPPIPELHRAADLLSEAADALLANDHELARDRLRQADMPAVHHHAATLIGRLDPFIHRRRSVEDAMSYPGCTRPGARMPGRAAQMSVYERDGWRCRYCECRVVLPTARNEMRTRLPDAIRWGVRADEQHAAFFALSGVIDHVVPHARGGTNDPGNLVTACQSCNFGRGHFAIRELGLLDPRTRSPINDEWDGLARILPAHVRIHGSEPAIPDVGSVANDAGVTNARA